MMINILMTKMVKIINYQSYQKLIMMKINLIINKNKMKIQGKMKTYKTKFKIRLKTKMLNHLSLKNNWTKIWLYLLYILGINESC